LAAGEQAQSLLADRLMMAGLNVLKVDGDFTQPRQLSRVAAGGPVTHRAKESAAKIVCASAELGQESVLAGVHAVKWWNRQHVGRLGEHALIPAD
jgi:hypothetical protein